MVARPSPHGIGEVEPACALVQTPEQVSDIVVEISWISDDTTAALSEKACVTSPPSQMAPTLRSRRLMPPPEPQPLSECHMPPSGCYAHMRMARQALL